MHDLRPALLGYRDDMATWDDVSRLAMVMPEAEEQPGQWRVRGKGFVWERPLRTADYAALGDAAPQGPILAARVADVGIKEALVADNPDAYFTTPHFDGYAAVLVQLEPIGVDELEELIIEAWLVQAPKRLCRQYLESCGLE